MPGGRDRSPCLPVQGQRDRRGLWPDFEQLRRGRSALPGPPRSRSDSERQSGRGRREAAGRGRPGRRRGLSRSADTHTLLCVSAQHLAVVQDAAAGVGRVPHAAGNGGGAGRGRLGPLPAEALARRGVARPLSYFLKRGIIEKLGPLLLLIPAFDRNCILEIIFFTF